MILGILIVFFSIILLIVLHELGHFLVAKKFGVKVEEFGIGIPPRIFGKKIGETIYSLNWIPIGAFVSIYGEDKKIQDPRSFSEKPIWQRFLIVVAGVVSFWLVAIVLLSIMSVMGLPAAFDDTDTEIQNTTVQVLRIEKDSPAQLAGIKTGDIIRKIEDQEIDKMYQVQETTKKYAGQEILVLIERDQELIEKSIILREFKENFFDDIEGYPFLGVEISRVGIKKYSWYEAPVQGFLMTGRLTGLVVINLGDVVYRLIIREPMPDEFEVVGPIGIGVMAFQFLEKGLFDYLFLIVLISISLAIFNLLPIPALDGGRILFLIIEKIKGKPINKELEKKLIGYSFILLLCLFVFVTFRDVLSLEFMSNFIEKFK